MTLLKYSNSFWKTDFVNLKRTLDSMYMKNVLFIKQTNNLHKNDPELRFDADIGKSDPKCFVFRDIVLKHLIMIDNKAFVDHYCQKHEQSNFTNISANPTPGILILCLQTKELKFVFQFPLQLNNSFTSLTSQPAWCWTRRASSPASQSSSWC